MSAGVGGHGGVRSRHHLERAYSKGHTMTAALSDLGRFAAASRAAAWITDEQAGEYLKQLTTPKAKQDFAKKLVERARMYYNIPDSEVDALAAGFADPSTRRSTERALTRFPFADPATQFVGHGYSLIMDAVYAEDEPLAQCHIVAIPAQWSTKLWHEERDLGEDGYYYSHWVYAELPSISIWDLDEPVSCVLVSENIYGSFHWGTDVVSLYRGEISLLCNRTASLVSEALGEFAKSPVLD